MQRDILSNTRAGYDRWATVYDRDANPLPALEHPIVEAMMGNVHGLSVLDLGCGTGRHALALAQAGGNVTALDFSAGMLAEARRKPGADTVRFLEHDLHTPLPLADGEFDRVVSGLVLEHLCDLPLFFGQVRRVLKDDGFAVISAMHPAMFLRDSRARFTDPDTGAVIEPGSLPHQISDFLNVAISAGLRLDHMSEHAPSADFAASYPRAEKYIGWPMLVVMRLKARY